MAITVAVAAPSGSVCTDTANISSALATVAAASGGLVTLQAGTYQIDQPASSMLGAIVIGTGTELAGQGSGVTVLQYASGGPGPCTGIVRMASGAGAVLVRGLTIDGNLPNLPGTPRVIGLYPPTTPTVDVGVINCTDTSWTDRGGIRGTGMVSVANGTTTYPCPDLSHLPNNGGSFVMQRYLATADFSQLRIVYGNWFDQGPTVPVEVTTGNIITVKAYVMVGKPGLRIPSTYRYVSSSANWNSSGSYVAGDIVRLSGVPYVANQPSTNQTPSSSSIYWDAQSTLLYPVHFAAEDTTRTVTIQPLQTVLSEPLAVFPYIRKGESFYVITLAQPNNGAANTGYMPLGLNYDTSIDWAVAPATGTAPLDYTSAPPASQASAASGTKVYTPMGVLGVPAAGLAKTPTVMLIGDSIMNGAGDTSNIMGDEFGGWGLRMLTDNPSSPTAYLYPHFRSSKPSSTGAAQQGPGTTLRMMMTAGATHIVDEFAVNDITAGSISLATIQANCVNRWRTYKAMGLKVYAITSTPQTTSTDSFATTGNQTPGANFGLGSKWAQYNDWIRTTPAPLDGYIDVAAVVLDSSGALWKAPGWTADGTHPTTSGHIAIAQSIDVAGLFGPPS